MVTARRVRTPSPADILSAPGPSNNPESASARSQEPVTEEQIRERAYELYEQRGRSDGQAWDDWFQAEAEVNRKGDQWAA